MTNISNLFGGEFKPPVQIPESNKTPSEQLIDAIASHGYEPPAEIIFDGNIHRFSTSGRARDDSGWYIAHAGKVHAGAFGCWKESTSINWRQDIGRELSIAEEMEHSTRMKQIRAKREEEQARLAATASETADTIWSNATDASDSHPYLDRKQVKSHGLRVTGDGRLIVPMISPDGEIASLQFIDSAGEKKYLSKGKAESAYFVLHGTDSTIYIAEGYATAATVHEITGGTTFIAFSAGQLANVAAMIRQSYAGDLVIVADHDESGTGQRKAEEAARASNARIIIPPIVGDANDYHVAGHDLAALLMPPVVDDWLIAADDFCQQPKPIKWLIKGFMQREALHMIHGPSGGGKTFFVLDQMLHVAAGFEDWNGHRTRGGLVVYLAGEGHHGLRGRIAAWKAKHNNPRLNMHISKGGTDLNTLDGLHRVRTAIMALPEAPAVIVVDTLHRFLSGDENSAQDAKTMLDACGHLQREFGCAVILVHHTGVSDEAQHRARGSSAWRGALDIEISVVPGSEDQPMQVVCRKMKDGEPFKPMQFNITGVPLEGWFDEDGEQVWSAVLESATGGAQKAGRPASNHERTFMTAWSELGHDMMRGCPYVSRSGLIDYLVTRCDMSEKSAAQVVKPGHRGGIISELMAAGMIEKDGPGWILLQNGNDAADALLSKPLYKHSGNEGNLCG